MCPVSIQPSAMKNSSGFASSAFASRTQVSARMPLRPEITALDRAALRPAARARFGLAPDAPTLLVTGGSLGAARI